jgi:hypothetical protein
MLAVTAGAFLVVIWIATKGSFVLSSGIGDLLKAAVPSKTSRMSNPEIDTS